MKTILVAILMTSIFSCTKKNGEKCKTLTIYEMISDENTGKIISDIRSAPAHEYCGEILKEQLKIDGQTVVFFQGTQKLRRTYYIR